MLDHIVEIAREAGRATLDVLKSDFDISYKSDLSPVTLADQRAHDIIKRGLEELTPQIPILSEEGMGVAYPIRREWREFYLVDPLDGTKEFIKRSGEFTVNIALIRDNLPIMGVIHVPVTGVTYYAHQGYGAFRIEEGSAASRIRVKEKVDEDGMIVASSRSHGLDGLDVFLHKYKIKENISAGSSLKFCLVAEGRADVYPRFGETWEWDTAAAQCIVEEAGGDVVDLEGNRLVYNKESLKHKGFIAMGSHRILDNQGSS
jgi:3'(2'), 5'-bisphosphate nucleotidase